MLPDLDPAVRAASEEIGEKLKEARLKAGLSQKTLAERIGMTRTSYARIEKGQTNVTVDSLVRIAEGLGLDLLVNFADKGSGRK